VAVAISGLAFGAMGVAVGGLAREVRAASLLAILVTLPLAFLALVPSGAVARASTTSSGSSLRCSVQGLAAGDRRGRQRRVAGAAGAAAAPPGADGGVPGHRPSRSETLCLMAGP